MLSNFPACKICTFDVRTVKDFSITPYLFYFRLLNRTTESVLITCILGCIHLIKLTFSQLKKVKIIRMTRISDLLNRPEIFSYTYEPCSKLSNSQRSE